MRTLHGYTVNVTDLGDPPPGDAGFPDAVVEMWTRDVDTFLDSEAAFAFPEDQSIVMQDDAAFIGESWIWQVDEEWVLGSPPEGELRTRTDGVKRVSLHRTGDAPSIGPHVVRVVDQRTLTPLTPGLVRDVVPGRPPYEADVIRLEWAPSVDAFGPVPGPAFYVSEYRQRVPDG